MILESTNFTSRSVEAPGISWKTPLKEIYS